MSPRPDHPPVGADSEGNRWLLVTRPLKDGPTPDITDDYYIKSICPSGAMAAGTASRYKTGPRLATHS